MCSFLFLFLILIVVFTNLQDFAQATIGNVETQGSASKSFGKKTVVLAQDWQSIFDSSIIDPCQASGFQASLQRFNFFEQNFSRDSSENVRGRGISLGLSLWQTQQEKCKPMCPLLGSLVERHQTRCHSQSEDIWRCCSLEQQLG